MNLPWKTILLQAPTIVEAARQLFAMSRQGRQPGALDAPGDDADEGDGLRHALAGLERQQEEQARLLADLARHVEELAGVLDTLRRRIRFALIVALSGAGLGVLSLLLWLVRAR